jgi:hypothetical protein
MKFIATLAAIATYASAINLSSEVDVAAAATVAVESKVEAKTEATADASASAGYDGPIVPKDYNYAVHDFNLNLPFTDQECYQKQVDIYSDQIIAIEALRLEVMQLTQRITQAEHDYDLNAQKIAENKAKIASNSRAALDYKAKI